MINLMDDDSQNSLDTLEEVTTQPSQNEPYNPQPKKQAKRWLLPVIVILIILLIASGIVFALTRNSKSQKVTSVTVNTQTLSNGTLQQVENSTGTSTGHVQLTIKPDTLFNGDLSVQGNTSLAKDVQIGQNLTVNGSGSFGGNLTVSGLITAAAISAGNITTKNFTLNGDLTIGGHVVTSGSKPTATPDVVAAGGTATVDGNDTSGTVSVTTGSGTELAGELVIIHFVKAYGSTPKVQLTSLNAASAELLPYIQQAAGFFAIETANAPKNNTVYSFNYSVTQ